MSGNQTVPDPQQIDVTFKNLLSDPLIDYDTVALALPIPALATITTAAYDLKDKYSLVTMTNRYDKDVTVQMEWSQDNFANVDGQSAAITYPPGALYPLIENVSARYVRFKVTNNDPALPTDGRSVLRGRMV